MSDMFAGVFVGALIGGGLVSIWHARRYQQLVDEVQRGTIALVAHHDQIVTGLIERLKQAEASP